MIDDWFAQRIILEKKVQDNIECSQKQKYESLEDDIIHVKIYFFLYTS
jgi:hypothetical protein